MPICGRTFLALAFATLLLTRPASAREISASFADTGGVEASLTRVRGSDREGQLASVGFAAQQVGFGYEKGISLRVLNTASLAAGPDGLQGGARGAVAGGYRFPFGTNHGVVLRGGLELGYFRNKHFGDATFELPQLQLGYQILTRFDDTVRPTGLPARPTMTRLFDVAAKGGYILFGRHWSGDEAWRNLSTAPEVGGIVSLHLGPVDLRGAYTRVLARGGGDAIDLVDASACGMTPLFTICENVRWEAGDVRIPAGGYRASEVTFIGLTVSLTKKLARLD